MLFDSFSSTAKPSKRSSSSSLVSRSNMILKQPTMSMLLEVMWNSRDVEDDKPNHELPRFSKAPTGHIGCWPNGHQLLIATNFSLARQLRVHWEYNVWSNSLESARAPDGSTSLRTSFENQHAPGWCTSLRPCHAVLASRSDHHMHHAHWRNVGQIVKY